MNVYIYTYTYVNVYIYICVASPINLHQWWLDSKPDPLTSWLHNSSPSESLLADVHRNLSPTKEEQAHEKFLWNIDPMWARLQPSECNLLPICSAKVSSVLHLLQPFANKWNEMEHLPSCLVICTQKMQPAAAITTQKNESYRVRKLLTRKRKRRMRQLSKTKVMILNHVQ